MPQTDQKSRQLELVMALDKARDATESSADPNAMFIAIVEILKAFFHADVCAIMLTTEDSDTIETIVASGISEEIAIEMCRLSMALTEPKSVSTETWPHSLGIHIIHDPVESSLGGLFLARSTAAFALEDIELLTVAESQIDSAVLQAHTVWNLGHHNRQLEAIYQIDRMRDSNPDENDLINHFTTLIVEFFKAELVMIFLSHIDDGDLILRGMIDKENLPTHTLNTIRELTGDLRIPQLIETPQTMESIKLLAAPLNVSGVRLGSVVIGRKTSFTIADHRLIFAMTSQMDSAIVHSRVIQQLYQRNRELETIYHIDQIRDAEDDFDKMLQKVLLELCRAVSSEMGYLMLYNEKDQTQLELKATTVDGIMTSPIYYDVIKKTSRVALDEAGPVYSNKPSGAVRSIVAIPLILNEKVIGVFGTVNSMNPRGFSAEDRRILSAITSQVDTAVFERLERRHMRQVLSRSVDPKVINHMLDTAHDKILEGKRVVLSVLFGDLRGSTEWTERTEPEELVSTLNTFLGEMTEIIFKYGGTLDKFVGDEVIALFGTPVSMEDHATRAVQCAMEMQEAHKTLQEKLRAEGIELPALGIGISSGEVIAGEFGPPIRTDFTAMGRVMNLGSRLCGIAVAGQVCMSKATYEMTKSMTLVRQLEPRSLKGMGEVHVYEITGLRV